MTPPVTLSYFRSRSPSYNSYQRALKATHTARASTPPRGPMYSNSPPREHSTSRSASSPQAFHRSHGYTQTIEGFGRSASPRRDYIAKPADTKYRVSSLLQCLLPTATSPSRSAFAARASPDAIAASLADGSARSCAITFAYASLVTATGRS